MVAGKAAVLAAAKFVRASATTVTVGGGDARVAAATPLAALAAVQRARGPSVRLRDYGACSGACGGLGRAVRDADRAGPQPARRRLGLQGRPPGRRPSAPPTRAGRRLRAGDRLTWFCCRAQSSGGCQRTLEVAPLSGRRPAAPRAGARLRRQRPRGRRGRRHGLARASQAARHRRRTARRASRPSARPPAACRPGAPAWSRLPGEGGRRREALCLARRCCCCARRSSPRAAALGAGHRHGRRQPRGDARLRRRAARRRAGRPRAGQRDGHALPAARSFSVQTRYGGGFVQAINGRPAAARVGRRVDWFYYVNGVEARKGAAARQLHRGDRVWWDRHDWSAAQRRARRSSARSPSRSSTAARASGCRSRIDCASGAAAACDVVGAPAARGRGARRAGRARDDVRRRHAARRRRPLERGSARDPAARAGRGRARPRAACTRRFDGRREPARAPGRDGTRAPHATPRAPAWSPRPGSATARRPGWSPGTDAAGTTAAARAFAEPSALDGPLRRRRAWPAACCRSPAGGGADLPPRRQPAARGARRRAARAYCAALAAVALIADHPVILAARPGRRGRRRGGGRARGASSAAPRC